MRRAAWVLLLTGGLLVRAEAEVPAPLRVELNRDSQAQLERVPGIGPQLSQQLIEARAQRPFQDWQDLTARIRGLGPARAARLSHQGLRVQGQPYGSAAAGRPAATSDSGAAALAAPPPSSAAPP